MEELRTNFSSSKGHRVSVHREQPRVLLPPGSSVKYVSMAL